MAESLLFIVGLTGVGKSTALTALRETRPSLTFLPNRRDLADEMVFPQLLAAAGKKGVPVTDRLERFRLTAAYRARHPGGLVHALAEYLAQHKIVDAGILVFDNIRGLDECRAAFELFANARFLFLDASPLVRLTRLIGRKDSFDEVSLSRLDVDFKKQLKNVAGLEHVFDPADLVQLAAAGCPQDELLRGVRIVVAEHENYDATAAAEFLRSNLDTARFLYVDSSKLTVGEVAETVEGWA